MPALLRNLAFLAAAAAVLALVAGGAALALRQLNLYPPDSIAIAAGAPGSAYRQHAEAYRLILARDGIELRVLETAGSVDNAASLAAAEGADIALVQGGVPLPADVQGIAAVFVEPLWLFSRAPAGGNPVAWDGLRVAAGAPGSGTRQVAGQLADVTGAAALTPGALDARGGSAAAGALLAGDVDIALFVAPVDAGYLARLFAAPPLGLLSLAQSEAVALRLPGARRVRLPSGIIDYRRPLPNGDVELVAVVARLVARDGLHPALVNRLVHAVAEVHGGAALLPADREYPAARDLGVTVNGYAAQLLEKGFSPLERVLPYWIVAQFNRVLLVLLPAIFLLLPLMRALPALYQSLLRRRVYRHYTRVHDIDGRLAADGERLGLSELAALQGELDDIEAQLQQANLPNSYRKQAYTLRGHLELVRRRGEEIARQRRADADTQHRPTPP